LRRGRPDNSTLSGTTSFTPDKTIDGRWLRPDGGQLVQAWVVPCRTDDEVDERPAT